MKKIELKRLPLNSKYECRFENKKIRRHFYECINIKPLFVSLPIHIFYFI